MDARDRYAVTGLLAILAGVALGALTASLRLPFDQVAVRLSADEARFWIAVTRIGDAWSRILIGLAIAAWLVWRGRAEAALALISIAAIETVSVEWMKDAFARLRPTTVPHLDPVSSLAFPSGHAAHPTTLLLLGATYVSGATRETNARAALWVIALLTALLIGVSRIMLGVHWPSDVLGGWVIGAGFAALGWALAAVPSRTLERNISTIQ